MIKVTITHDEGAVEVMSMKDGETLSLSELLEELIFPAVLGSGYHPDSLRSLAEGSELENIL